MRNIITKVKNSESLDIFLFIFFWFCISGLYMQAAKTILDNGPEKTLKYKMQQQMSLVATEVKVGQIQQMPLVTAEVKPGQEQRQAPVASEVNNLIVAEHAKFKKILKDDYAIFVKELGENINDPKFLAVIRAGDRELDKVVFDHFASYPASQLIPTQNEIDVEKSLKYPLSKEDSAVLAEYLNSKNGLNSKGEAFAPGGMIVTAGGKYIIDGHHRWSQLYLINPNAKIKALNMNIDDPVMALKVAQLAIGSIAQKIPSAVIEGKNLLTMTRADFDKWIKENISQKAIKAFCIAGKLGKSCAYDAQSGKATVYDEPSCRAMIVDYIWENAIKMRKENSPIPMAPSRGIMPQTDTAAGWSGLLEQGALDIR